MPLLSFIQQIIETGELLLICCLAAPRRVVRECLHKWRERCIEVRRLGCSKGAGERITRRAAKKAGYRVRRCEKSGLQVGDIVELEDGSDGRARLRARKGRQRRQDSIDDVICE